ncbi:MAG: ABC transporter ATP-binding protein [Acidobacteriia bacterium]|nr:ABC transporter ATP-binding protein [Terriglobia bacterium]MBV9742633.1 ABC transporter ATP-binding protein [Terriglobia bacterium]
MSVIRFQNVTKSFPRHRGHMLLREHLIAMLRGAHRERFYALKHVSFILEKGESLAVIGHNGAGKSTLLGLVAGLAKPDSGSVEVYGRIAALLELGSGFHPDLTGRENVSLNASLLGLTREQTKASFDSILDFSGIADFIDEPLRTYSSGMMMRLAFSIAVNVDPDILLIDEVLAVGDAAFQAKCFDRIREFRHAGKALVCVSHGAGMIRELCDRAIWLDHGELVTEGSVDKVLAAYAGTQSSISTA